MTRCARLPRGPGAILLGMFWVAAVRLAAAPAEGPIGWASVAEGTTGGAGGPVVVVRDADALAAAVTGDASAIVVVAGTIELSGMVRVGSNKSLVGGDAGATLAGGGLTIARSSNVVVRNLTFRDSRDDAISVERESRHVWIDHCDLSRAQDGLVDIKRGGDLVTVSWCHFHDHAKASLVGHGDDPDVVAMDRGRLRVTYHHNFFDGSKTRHPRVRVGETVHVFNNHFRGNEYGVASTDGAGVLVEGNYFEGVDAPTHTSYGDSKRPGRLVERDNVFAAGCGRPAAAGEVAAVPYRYVLDPAQRVPDLVRAGAGVIRTGQVFEPKAIRGRSAEEPRRPAILEGHAVE